MSFPRKQHITELAEIAYQKGVQHAVISPGSRNAPLINAFLRQGRIKCHSIVDERSAAFYALGMAQQTGKPVAVISTSGTAVLNYAPALAEAFYQQLPLIAITADRPVEWIDQQDNQTIRQQNIYTNYIKKSFQLPQETKSETDIWHSQRIVSEALNQALQGPRGPVHLNIPLEEPLYDNNHYKSSGSPKLISVSQSEQIFPEEEMNLLSGKWNESRRKMIICGQQGKKETLNKVVNKLAEDPSVIVVAENLSNLSGEYFIDNPDRVLAGMKDSEALAPDLVVSIGGPVVSKRLKFFLRAHKPAAHWRIDPESHHYDTYQSLTNIIVVKPVKFFEQLTQRIVNQGDDNYREAWTDLKEHTGKLHQTFLQKAAFSDLKVFEILLQKIPEAGYLHLGNSSPVRYSQFFESKPALNYYANRGTSGIDGCLSTAAGAAMISNKLSHTVILGDLSFVYDSNALWNKDLPDNLRMVVINNQGGGIFRMIDGPSGKEGFSEFFETKHPVSIRKLAEAFGLKYLVAEDEKSLTESLDELFRQQKAALLEVQTPGETSAAIYKNYLNFLKE